METIRKVSVKLGNLARKHYNNYKEGSRLTKTKYLILIGLFFLSGLWQLPLQLPVVMLIYAISLFKLLFAGSVAIGWAGVKLALKLMITGGILYIAYQLFIKAARKARNTKADTKTE